MIAKVFFSSRLYTDVQEVKNILHYNAPSRISFYEASNENILYKETSIGKSFGTTYV